MRGKGPVRFVLPPESRGEADRAKRERPRGAARMRPTRSTRRRALASDSAPQPPCAGRSRARRASLCRRVRSDARRDGRAKAALARGAPRRLRHGAGSRRQLWRGLPRRARGRRPSAQRRIDKRSIPEYARPRRRARHHDRAWNRDPEGRPSRCRCTSRPRGSCHFEDERRVGRMDGRKAPAP